MKKFIVTTATLLLIGFCAIAQEVVASIEDRFMSTRSLFSGSGTVMSEEYFEISEFHLDSRSLNARRRLSQEVKDFILDELLHSKLQFVWDKKVLSNKGLKRKKMVYLQPKLVESKIPNLLEYYDGQVLFEVVRLRNNKKIAEVWAAPADLRKDEGRYFLKN
ncbi:MAG TPA: hypothetical protein VGE63_02295 [Candidatus Paceibacterota bacterium]